MIIDLPLAVLLSKKQSNEIKSCSIDSFISFVEVSKNKVVDYSGMTALYEAVNNEQNAGLSDVSKAKLRMIMAMYGQTYIEAYVQK